MVKKLIKYLVLFVVLCFSMSTDVIASDYEENYSYYTLSDYSVDGTYTLSFGLNHKKKIAAVTGFKVGDGFNGSVEIPSTIQFATDGENLDTYTVVGILKKAFTENKSLMSIKLPDTVTFLMENSFYKCSSLSKVELGTGLEVILSSCFSCCNALSEINLENTKVVELSDSVFYDCNSLKNITLPESLLYIGEKCFYSCDNLDALVLPKELIGLGDFFIGGTAITSLYVPKTLKNVYSAYDGALNDAEALKSVTIEEGATNVINSFFEDTALEEIILPSTLTHLDEGAFYNATLPSNFVLPDGITNVGVSAFYKAILPSNFVLPDSITNIGKTAFYSTSLPTDFKLPASLKVIGEEAFSYTVFESDLILPECLEELGYRAFRRAKLYNSVLQLPKSLKKIGSSCFSGCDVIEIVVNSDLGACENAFITETGYGWVDTNFVEKITVAEGVTNIPRKLFYGCLTETVILPESLESISADVFTKSSVKEVHLGSNLTSIGTGVFENSKLQKAVIPSGVTVIKDGTFAGCKDLTSVEFLGNITEIEQEAFQGSGIESITLPSGVSKIGVNAFSDCEYLKEIVLSASLDSASLYNILGESTKNCPSLKNLVIPYLFTHINSIDTKFETLYIPESIKSIDETVTVDKVGKIIGVKGSYAETFANEKQIPFEEGIEVTDFDIVEYDKELTIGASTYVVLDITPQNIKNKVVWSSSNEDIVTVDHRGLVTAVGGGTATITVTIGDLTKSVDIKVLKPIEEIDIDAVYLRVVGQKVKVKVSCYPADAEEKYQYRYYPDDKIYTLHDGGIIIANGVGTKYTAIRAEVLGTSEVKSDFVNIRVFGEFGIPVLELYSGDNGYTQSLMWARDTYDWKNDCGHEGVEIFKYNKEKDDWILFADVVTGTNKYVLKTGKEFDENVTEGENVFKARYYVFDKDDNKMYGEFSEKVSFVRGDSTEELLEKQKEEFKSSSLTAKLEKDALGYSLVWDNVGADGYEISNAITTGVVTVKAVCKYRIPEKLSPENYKFTVNGYKVFNGEKVYCKQSNTVGYTVKLAIVKNLKQKSTYTNKIEIVWGSVTGATGYEVYKANTKNAKYTKVTTSSKANCKQSVTGGSSYWYKVRAYKVLSDGTKMYGAYSTPTKLYSKPSTPVISVKKVSGKQIKVSWQKSVGANTYEIYMSTSKSGTYRLVTRRNSTHNKYYTVGNLTKGKTYYFKVRTYKLDSSGNKIYSSWSSVKSLKLSK